MIVHVIGEKVVFATYNRKRTHVIGGKDVFVTYNRKKTYRPSVESRRRLRRELNHLKVEGKVDIWPKGDGFIAYVDSRERRGEL